MDIISLAELTVNRKSINAINSPAEFSQNIIKTLLLLINVSVRPTHLL